MSDSIVYSASRIQRGPSSSDAPDAWTFDYQAVGPDTLAPLIPVRFTANRFAIADWALIDTGADSSALPLWMMRQFGIRKSDCRREKFDAAGGSAVQWIWPGKVTAVILEKRLRVTSIFTDTPLPLLGRDDFLRRFKVRFDQHDHEGRDLTLWNFRVRWHFGHSACDPSSEQR